MRNQANEKLSPLPLLLKFEESMGAMLKITAMCVAAWLSANGTAAESSGEVERALPAPASGPVDFERDIRPIFERSCIQCHGGERPRAGLRLTDRTSALKGSLSGPVIVPGQSAESLLVQVAAGLVEEMLMPPEGKGEPLTAEEIGRLRAWIDAGAPWSEGEPGPLLFTMAPYLRWVAVEGDEGKFREHAWEADGWSGGIERFSIEQQTDPRTSVRSEGEVRLGTERYRLTLDVDRYDVGYLRFGAEQYRRWFDDTGGYHAAFSPPAFHLGRDLHLDIQRSWFDAGLTLPGWPRLRFGYERRGREGDRSILQWGTVADASGVQKKIYPGVKAIEEETHIVKFDASYESRGLLVENEFRAEWHEMETARATAGRYDLPSQTLARGVRVNETYRHFQAADGFRVEKQMHSSVLLSAGHFFSVLDGEAALGQATFAPPGAVLTSGDRFWSAQNIVLDQNTHVLNLSARLGPWNGLTIHGGLQNEWMRQKGVGEANLADARTPDNPVSMGSDIDKAGWDERVGVRYTGLPFTVLFAEAKLEQEEIGHFEALGGMRQDFLRDTDSESDGTELKAGAAVSPWTWLSTQLLYRWRERKTEYNHLEDTSFGMPNPGYTAFIRSREIESDDVRARLVLRPARWVKATLAYQWVGTLYETETDPHLIPPLIIPGVITLPGREISPGGSHEAGEYRASIYSAQLGFTPVARLVVTAMASLRDARTSTSHPGFGGVVDYEGETVSAGISSSYRINDSTDWTVAYDFSRADYAQDNAGIGLPLGIEYSRHSVQTGIGRRFPKGLFVRFLYGYFQFEEPTHGTMNDYRAHAVFVTLRKST